MDKIITISRQYASGGREIGQKLAELFDIPFYDNELITQAAKASGFAESIFERAEEKATNSLLYSIAMGMNAYNSREFGFLGYNNMSLDDRIFIAQSDIIRKVAKEGPCVIIGRCADYILREQPNVVNIFVHAGMDFRIHRATSQYGLAVEKAAENIMKRDKRRANYHNYHSDEKWGNINNYDLAVKTDFGGVDHAVQCIKAFVEINSQLP